VSVKGYRERRILASIQRIMAEATVNEPKPSGPNRRIRKITVKIPVGGESRRRQEKLESSRRAYAVQYLNGLL